MITELEFQSLARAGYHRIPLVTEAFADLETPLSLYLKLAGGAPHSFLLESVVGGERFGRYSFIGWPARTLLRASALDGGGTLTEVVTDGVVVEPGDMVCLHTGFAEVVLSMHKKPDPAVLNNRCAVLDGRDDKLLQWISDSQIAVIAAEDQKFAEHWGFDVAAIRAALKHNQQSRRVRGASTLSQQTAKNLFMWSDRSFLRKGIEAWFTLLMELGWDKSRILEVYLNIVEFGPGIYGAEAAARHYFGKPAIRLTRYEASLLAAALPNPWRYRVKPPSPYVQQRSAWIRRQMGQLGQVTLNRVHGTE